MNLQNFNIAIVKPATKNTAKISYDDDEETTVFAYTSRVLATTKFKNSHVKFKNDYSDRYFIFLNYPDEIKLLTGN